MRGRRECLSLVVLAILLLACLAMQGGVGMVEALPGTPAVHVDPRIIKIEPPGTFDININVTDIVYDPDAKPPCNGLYAWGFWLEFNPSVLQVASHFEEGWKVDTWYGNGTQTTFQTTKWPVVPGSEEVYVNEVPMNKPADYTIDYPTGTITFTTAPASEAEIIAMYQFYVTVYHVTSGHFLEKIGWPTAWGTGIVAPDVDNVNGVVSAGDVIMPNTEGEYPPVGASGSGILATITFEVKGEGASLLHLDDTDLETVVGEPPNQNFSPIKPHDRLDGFFEYPPRIHDIAITDVTAYPPSVPAGEPVSINVTVKNEGEVAETFSVIAYYDNTAIKTQTVTDLATLDETTLTFTWDKTDVAAGTYTIKATAILVDRDHPEVPLAFLETDTDDNIYDDGTITVTTPPGSPKASFVISPYPPYSVGDTLTFNSTSTDEDGWIDGWEWDLNGDSIIDATTDNTTYTYTEAGTYTVNLTVTDNDGLTDTATTYVTISWVHDVAVTNLMVSPNKVKIGEPVYINMTVANEGNCPDPEKFPVYSYYNDTVLHIWQRAHVGEIAAGTEKTLNWTWNTTKVAAGEYIIKAVASNVTGEINTANNEFVDGTVTIEKPSSFISISASPTTLTLGENTTITGSIPPEHTGVQVTIQYRPAGGSWSELPTVTTDGDSQYSYVWTPTTPGTYELKASWEGDDYALAAESNVITIEVVEIHDIPLEVGGVSFHVVTESNSTVSNFEFIRADKKISFNVTGPAGTVTYCNVTIPKDLLDAPPGQWIVLVDGDSIIPVVTNNATHTSIYFTYNLSTRKVEIIGATVATPPTALFTPSPTSAYVDEKITFDASASYDEDGDIDSWDWDFDGDGVIDATGEIVEYAYSSTGNYTVTLTVTDDDGLTDIATDTVIITAQEAPALGILLYVAATVVAAIVIVAIAFYFLKARKQG